MTFHLVFLLPLLALALAVFLPLFKRQDIRLRSFKSRRYRKIMLGRIAFVVLVLATLATLIWPIASMNSLVQGLCISAAVLVPLIAINWVVTYWSGSQQKMDSDTHDRNREKNLKNLTTRKRNPASTASTVKSGLATTAVTPLNPDVERLIKSDRTAEGSSADAISLHQRVAPLRAAEPAARLDVVSDSSSRSVVASAIQSRGTDQGHDGEVPSEETQEQMVRVADLVQTYDLGVAGFSGSAEADSKQNIQRTHNTRSVLSRDLTTADAPTSDLARMSTSEVTELVVGLRQSKNRLQKLVIAQQSAIDSERRAHDQSRTVARDAIKIMQLSRKAQKVAEKLGRRERTERQRVEMQYKEVSGALNNALSIIAKRSGKVSETAQSNGSGKHLSENDLHDDILA